VAEGERLRHQLAEHDREVGDADDDDHERDRLGDRKGEPEALERLPERVRDRRAAERRGGGADDGDADLDGGEKALGLDAERLHRPRPARAGFDELQEAGLSQREDGDLGPGEDAVQENEDQDRRELDHAGGRPFYPASAQRSRGGRFSCARWPQAR
jgi:hypothetical protein